MLNQCSENYIETTSKKHVEIPSGKRRQKNFHFQPVCQRCYNATGHMGLTLNRRQNACRGGSKIKLKTMFYVMINVFRFLMDSTY